MHARHIVNPAIPALLMVCLTWATSVSARSHAGRSEIQGGASTYVRMSRQGPAIGNAHAGDYFYAAGRSSSVRGYTWGFVKTNRQGGRGYTGCGWVDSSRLVNRIVSADSRATARDRCGSTPLHEYRES